MNIRHIAAATLAATLAATSASALTTNLVMNGDFEDVDDRPGNKGLALNSLAGATGNNSWDVYSSLPGGWTSTVGTGIEVQTDATVPQINAQSGKHYIELDSERSPAGSNSNMQQSIDLAVGQYLLSFWYSPRTNQIGTNGVAVSIDPNVGGVSGSTLPLLKTVVNSNVGTWTQFSYLFTVLTDESPILLSFTADGTADTFGGFIDTVSITAVPLPASALLLLGGVGGLALFRRRQTV
jgi:hypothetical protein